jgi:hypothetical protein
MATTTTLNMGMTTMTLGMATMIAIGVVVSTGMIMLMTLSTGVRTTTITTVVKLVQDVLA